MLSKLPVTVLCGFLGSGKNTGFNQVLANGQGLRVAVIVRDTNDGNIAPALVRSNNSVLSRTEAILVKMSNGCREVDGCPTLFQ